MSHKKHTNVNSKDNLKISAIEKKCEESLNEILRSASEAKEISKNAEEELERQTEQIKHINKETDGIQENLNETQYHLQGIKHWWKNINSFLGFETFKNNENKKTDNQLIETKKSLNHNDNNEYIKNDQIYRNRMKTETISKRRETFEEKYESGLNSLSVMLDELHSRALIMGNTINEQNKMLNEVNEKMENNIEKIKIQQKLMKEIMKK